MPRDRADPPALRGAPEFSRPLSLGLVGPEGRQEVLDASEAECAALARRFDILGIACLRAELRLKPEVGGAVRVSGRLSASVTQACVTTLEPVEQRVEEELAFRLLPPGQPAEDGPEDIDEIETEGGVADLGEIVAEELALALDPYPRAPGAELPEEARDASGGAFAALAALKRKN
jgi:uncharacterized metal-binding protein YceD (DUF177 family)